MLILILLGIIMIIVAKEIWKTTEYNYPPGPMSIPIFGHSLQISKLGQLDFAKWLYKQGDIVRLKLNGKNWIGVNSMEIANLLLIKNGTNFSSRPFIPLVSDIIFRNSAIALLPYGTKWRKHRRLVHNLINPIRINQMELILQEEVDIMMNGIESALKETNYLDLCEFVYDYAFSVILRILFGRIEKSPPNSNDKPCHIFRKLAHDSFLLVAPPKFNLYKFLPYGHKYSESQVEESKLMQQKLDGFIQGYLNQVRDQMKEGIADPSISRTYFEPRAEEEQALFADFTNEEFMTFITNFLLAAAETVGDNLAWMVASITKYQSYQKQAQLQLNQLPKDRKPSIKDMKAISCINNIIKETLRLYPSNPFNLPRENTHHFVFDGYDIPPNTTIVLNLYAINRDGKKYDQPHEFNPSRYDSINNNNSLNDLDPSTFGLGRRMCPGLHLAKAEMFLAISHLLYNYRLTENSHFPIILDSDGRSVSNPPLPFKVCVEKRYI